MDSDMDKQTLSTEMISDGRKFLAALDQSGFAAKAAYWELLKETGKWELSIVLPEHEDADPLPDVQQLLRVFREQDNLRQCIGFLGLGTRLCSDVAYEELKETMERARRREAEPGWLGNGFYFYRAR